MDIDFGYTHFTKYGAVDQAVYPTVGEEDDSANEAVLSFTCRKKSYGTEMQRKGSTSFPLNSIEFTAADLKSFIDANSPNVYQVSSEYIGDFESVSKGRTSVLFYKEITLQGLLAINPVGSESIIPGSRMSLSLEIPTFHEAYINLKVSFHQREVDANTQQVSYRNATEEMNFLNIFSGE